jgi:nucleoside-diphosphate kinase
MDEQTLVLIKPDAMQKHIVGKIIDRFEGAKMEIVNLQMLQLTQELLDTWYAHHKTKSFFPELCKFMMETPVVAIVLQGKDVVARVRDLIGPTDSTKASKGTIRGDWGESVQKNLVHASDGVERAKFEIELLFGKSCESECCGGCC